MSRIRTLLSASIFAIAAVGALPAAVLAANPACGSVLTTDTTLEANLDCAALLPGDAALYIGADGIVLDLNGYTISGPPGYDQTVGIMGDDWDGWHVTNGTISDFWIGVYFNSSSNLAKASWLTVVGNVGVGDDFGVYSSGGTGNKIKNNTISDADRGVYLQRGAGHRVRNNHVTADVGAFETSEETSTRFYDNTALAPTGFKDIDSGNLWFVGNTANGGGTGFDLSCHTNGRVVAIGNEANNNSGDGFVVTDCYAARGGKKSKSIFEDNDASGNGGIGFYATRNYNSTWFGNNADGNGSEGFYLVQPGGYEMRWNDADGNTSSGVALRDNLGNDNVRRFADNTASFNGEYGFEADYGVPGRRNKAHDNAWGNCVNVRCS